MPTVTQPTHAIRRPAATRRATATRGLPGITPLRLLSVACLAVILAIPLAGAGASEQIDVTGEVVLEHAEDFVAGIAREQKVLETKRGRFVLDGRYADAARIGSTVRVKGKRTGDTLVLADSGSITTLSDDRDATSSTTLAAATTSSKRVAVLLINFTDPPPPATPSPSPSPSTSPDPSADPSAEPTAPPSPTLSPSPSPTPVPPKEPWTKSFVRGVYFTNTKSVAAYFGEVSNGKQAISGDVFGYFTVPAKTTSCNYSDWSRTAREMATAAGINLSAYDHVVHAWGRLSACWWGGMAQVYGKYNWINGSMTPYVTMHELGHNLGAHHASSMTCTKDGVRVRLSGNCSVDEYGDPFDVMGQNASGGSLQRHLQTWHRRQLGYLGSADQLTVTENGHYSLATAQVAGGTPRVIRIVRNSSQYYYLEFRQPYGLFDNYSSTAAVVNGVLVRLAPDTKRTQSFLLDMNPSTSSFSDAALAVGQTFSHAGISITTKSISSAGAKLRIQVEPDTTPPTTPGNLTATLVSARSLALSWTASKDELEVTHYRVRRDGVVLATLKVGTHSYTDSTLIDGVTYNYSVEALDAAKNASVPATISYQIPDSTPPSAPTNVSASQSGPRSVTISWQAATDNGVVAQYRVRRNGGLLAKTSNTTFEDTSAMDGYSYSYEVRAEDAAGNLGPTASAVPSPINLPDVTPPSAPGSFSLKALTTSSTSLSWTAASDNVAVSGYRVSRDGVLVATLGPGATSFSESSLPAGTYSYAVVAFDAAGNVGPALTSSVSLLSTETSGPSAPKNLAGTALDARYVSLTWEPSTGGTGSVTYRVFRDGVRIASGLTATTFTDQPASVGTYSYTVRAVDGAGKYSPFSSPISVTAIDSSKPTTPKSLTAKALDDRYVSLGWQASTGGTGSITYRVFRDGVRIAKGLTRTSFTDRPASVGTYSYTVRAVDSAGKMSPHSSPVSATAVTSLSSSPSAPTNLKARSLDWRYIDLSWTASSGGSGSVTYRVFRDGVRIAKGVSTTTFKDRPASFGSYTYKVRAVDGAGNFSPFSNSVLAKAVKSA